MSSRGSGGSLRPELSGQSTPEELLFSAEVSALYSSPRTGLGGGCQQDSVLPGSVLPGREGMPLGVWWTTGVTISKLPSRSLCLLQSDAHIELPLRTHLIYGADFYPLQATVNISGTFSSQSRLCLSPSSLSLDFSVCFQIS